MVRSGTTVRHATGSYEVHVTPGIAAEAAARVASLLPGRRLVVVTDATLRAALAAAGRWPKLDAEVIEIPAGEVAKTRDEWARVTDRLLALGVGRDSCLVAIGGGSVGDLAGFVAATYLRGIPFVQIPTTLLAMVDASVGGKVGVDTPEGKNLLGAFHPPALVLADPGLLSTLPDPIYREGLAEALKHGLVADAEYFSWIMTNAEALVRKDAALVTELVRRSVEIKAGVVSRDEHESGERAILNAGHTVGHALETENLPALRHGDAVAMGLVIEARIAEDLGVAEAGLAETIEAALLLLQLPASSPGFSLDLRSLIARMHHDKKNRGGVIRMALPAAIGRMARDGDAWTIAIPEERITLHP